MVQSITSPTDVALMPREDRACCLGPLRAAILPTAVLVQLSMLGNLIGGGEMRRGQGMSQITGVCGKHRPAVGIVTCTGLRDPHHV